MNVVALLEPPVATTPPAGPVRVSTFMRRRELFVTSDTINRKARLFTCGMVFPLFNGVRKGCLM